MATDNQALTKKISGVPDVAGSFKKQVMAMAVENSTRLAMLAGAPSRVDDKGLTGTAKELFSGLMYAVLKNPYLAQCKLETIRNCMLQSAATNLFPGALNECYYVPYGKEVTFIPDYRGLIKLAYQSEFVKDLNVGVVYPNEFFEWEKGTNHFLRHKPTHQDDLPENALYFYCVIHTTTGGTVFEVVTKEQAEGIKKQSTGKMKRPEYSPWVKHFVAMGLKTAVKRTVNTLPKSKKLQRAMQIDHAAETQDLSTAEIIDADYETVTGDQKDEN